MTSDRPYRKAMSTEAAFAELAANAGSHFDPACALRRSYGLGRMSSNSCSGSRHFRPISATIIVVVISPAFKRCLDDPRPDCRAAPHAL